ncbi:DNA polymerase/3'-5' exonuclease PolX [Edaphobacillus lindanitolerans]|uniref:DNA-directed DNA polymerase n=1 Tax=Edaphobacillus lindanitolerans TaxID=550447 RepID=A0A1U7PQK4_9BACI|nr:DNA polymerase/3'-5' exonuclease PolX [Edaphobacillus lindanitolerans]SIT83679.1 DNA polymerase (family 10) [Edaphobacillus lindanitolerans]
MNKKIIIRTLEEIALHMELLGENPFKVGAFRKAAGVLEQDPRSLAEMDDILSLKGIGKGTGAVITDLMEKGESDLLAELREEVPDGLIPLLKIPGLGGKKIAKLHQELGIDSAGSLKAACEDGRVSQLPGFGKKTEEKILAELETFGRRPDKLPHWELESVVRLVETALLAIPEAERFLVTGSYRRMAEMSSDLDFIVVTESPERVTEGLMNSLPVLETIGSGDAKLSVTIDAENPVDADFRFVAEEQFASAIHHFTGAKEHNVRLRQLAKERGEKISEYGVEQEDGTVLTFNSEEEFFAHFDLPFFPPAVRKDGREFGRTEELKGLIRPEDIRSDLHMHTVWSDGAESVREMAEACRERGYSHIVITDHSRYLRVANGLTPERLREQIREVREVDAEMDGITVLCGTEMDILPDATLDFDDGLLSELDFVIASIHSNFNQPREKIMERLHAAISNPHVDMIAHPTGRIIGRREGYSPDLEQLIEWAAQYGKILELNANPYRLDMAEEWLELAQKKGVPIAINTDAHSVGQLGYMETGVRYAQRAWLNRDLIVNTWSLERFLGHLKG